MRASNPIYFVTACLLASMLLIGCQKGTPRSIQAQLGKGLGEVDSSATKANNDQLEEAIQNDKSMVCSEKFLKDYAALMAQITEVNKILSTSQDKKTDANLQKDLAEKAKKIKVQSDLLTVELLKSKAAFCQGRKVVLADMIMSVNKTLIAISEFSGTAIDEASKAENERLDKLKLQLSLINQKFQLSKEMAEVLDENHTNEKMFVMSGKIEAGKENYERAVTDNSDTVCTLTTAPKTQLLQSAILTVLSVTTTTSEKPQKEASDNVVKASVMMVRLSTADQFVDFTCLLAHDGQVASKNREFTKAFGSLLTLN